MFTRILENFVAAVLATLLISNALVTFDAWRDSEPGPFVYLGRAHFDAKAAPESAFKMSAPRSSVTTDQVHADIVTFKNISTETIKDFRLDLSLLDSRNTHNGEDVFRAWHRERDLGGNTIVKFRNDGSDSLFEDLRRSDISSTGKIRIVFEKFGPGAKVDIHIYSKTDKRIQFKNVNDAAEVYDCCSDGSLPLFVTNKWLIASSILSAIIAAIAISYLFWLNSNTTRIPKVSILSRSKIGD